MTTALLEWSYALFSEAFVVPRSNAPTLALQIAGLYENAGSFEASQMDARAAIELVACACHVVDRGEVCR